MLIIVTNTILYGLLLAQDTIPFIGLSALGLLCLVNLIFNDKRGSKSPILLPVLGLIAFLPVSGAISIDLGLTLPKLYGVILSIVFVYSLANFINSISRLRLTTLTLLLLTFAIPVVGFLATNWSGSSFTLPSRILARLGQYIPQINKFLSGGGIHVNTLAGTLSFFVPLLLSLLWDDKAINRTYLNQSSHPALAILAVKLLVVFSLILSSVLLVFTQSRGSYLGVGVGILVLVIWKNPHLYWLIFLFIAIIFAAFLVFADGNLVKFVSLLDTTREGDTLQVRLDYWKRTVSLIQDFPITGVGLGTYGKVYDTLYNFTPLATEDYISFYAHNMYLGVAASMGLPALILYFALFSSTATMVISAYRKVRSVARVLLMGLSCGILANLIYGLWDNYLLGEKLAVVLWIYLGVINAIYIHQGNMGRRISVQPESTMTITQTDIIKSKTSFWFSYFLFGIGSWVLFSLAAIAFININPYISLGIAMIGGVLLGIYLTYRFEIRNHRLQSPSIA
ncbi:O-antigen ligase family protein [bacterium]|nr:O-antigen ligase family protein [bacterium]